MSAAPRDVIAGFIELRERRNPSMSGPSPQDYRAADDLLALLEAWGFRIEPPEVTL